MLNVSPQTPSNEGGTPTPARTPVNNGQLEDKLEALCLLVNSKAFNTKRKKKAPNIAQQALSCERKRGTIPLFHRFFGNYMAKNAYYLCAASQTPLVPF